MRSGFLLLAGALLAFPSAFAQGVTPPPEPPPLTESQKLDQKGDLEMARKLYREAVESYAKALSLDPKNAVISNKIGIAYHQMQQLNMARRFYEHALKLNKEYAEAINNLGTVYYAQKHNRKAIHFYNRALKLKPGAASIYSNLGTALFVAKKYDEAFAAYRQALALDPEVFEHRSTYGTLLQERSVGERAQFHFFMARTYASTKNFERSLEYLRKALEEGFRDTKKIYDDPVFAELVKTPPFAELMANPPATLQ